MAHAPGGERDETGPEQGGVLYPLPGLRAKEHEMLSESSSAVDTSSHRRGASVKAYDFSALMDGELSLRVIIRCAPSGSAIRA